MARKQTTSEAPTNSPTHGVFVIEGEGDNTFAARKNRGWNDAFRQRNGREVREAFAERLTAFCRDHGINYVGDARPNAEQGLPDPEPELPRWNFEYAERTGTTPEALTALQDHRRRRRQWEAAQAEAMEAALELTKLEAHARQRRQQRLAPVLPANGRPSAKLDRRAAVLRAWYRSGWIDAATIPNIASVRYDEKRDLLWIDLRDGATIIDRGDEISAQGRLTWNAALETAAAAERHGWKSVQVHGDQAYKDAVAVACMLCGIEVRNHALSLTDRTVFERLVEEQAKRSASPNGTGSASDDQRGRRSLLPPLLVRRVRQAGKSTARLRSRVSWKAGRSMTCLARKRLYPPIGRALLYPKRRNRNRHLRLPEWRRNPDSRSGDSSVSGMLWSNRTGDPQREQHRRSF